MSWEARNRNPSPEAGEGRVGAMLPLDSFFAGENNPHPNPPPAWGRGNCCRVCHMGLSYLPLEELA